MDGRKGKEGRGLYPEDGGAGADVQAVRQGGGSLDDVIKAI